MTCNRTMRLLTIFLLTALVALVAGCDDSNRNVYQGYIEGDYVYISSTVGGTVANVPVVKGDRAEAGALLFELDPEPESSIYRETLSQLRSAQALYEDKTRGMRSSELDSIEASIRQAEAALAFSTKEYERLKALYDKNVIGEERLDSAETAHTRDLATVAELRARLKTAALGARRGQIEAALNDVSRAQAALDRAQWALDQKRVFTPEPGLVVDVLYAVGEYAPPGYPVTVLLPPGKINVRFFIPEPELSTIKTGQRFDVLVQGYDAPVEGTIRYIFSEAEYTPPFIYSKDNREKLVFMVEGSFEPEIAEGLNPGQPVEIRLRP